MPGADRCQRQQRPTPPRIASALRARRAEIKLKRSPHRSGPTTRLAIRLIRREDISAQILITLRIFLMMHPKALLSCSKQISYGLHELIRTNASDIRYSRDWITILTVLQVVGAGANPPIVKPGPCLTLVSGDLYAQQGGGAAGTIQEERVDSETGEVYQTPEQIDRGMFRFFFFFF